MQQYLRVLDGVFFPQHLIRDLRDLYDSITFRTNKYIVA